MRLPYYVISFQADDADDRLSGAPSERNERIGVRRPEPDAGYRMNFVASGVMGVFTEPATHALVSRRPADPDAYRRYDRYLEVLTDAAGVIDVTTATALARDHDGTPGRASICKHATDFRTGGAIVFLPTRRRALIAKGPPCESNFVEIALFAEQPDMSISTKEATT